MSETPVEKPVREPVESMNPNQAVLDAADIGVLLPVTPDFTVPGDWLLVDASTPQRSSQWPEFIAKLGIGLPTFTMPTITPPPGHVYIMKMGEPAQPPARKAEANSYIEAMRKGPPDEVIEQGRTAVLNWRREQQMAYLTERRAQAAKQQVKQQGQ